MGQQHKHLPDTDTITARFARSGEVVAIAGLCHQSLRNLEKQGRFPPHRRITGKAKGWWLPDVLAWAQDPQSWGRAA